MLLNLMNVGVNFHNELTLIWIKFMALSSILTLKTIANGLIKWSLTISSSQTNRLIYMSRRTITDKSMGWSWVVCCCYKTWFKQSIHNRVKCAFQKNMVISLGLFLTLNGFPLYFKMCLILLLLLYILIYKWCC